MNIFKWQLHLIQLLTIPGLLVSYYLYLFHEGSLMAACSGSQWFDCGQVSGPNAPFSSIGPVPVALIGLIGYLLLFLLIWASHWWQPLRNSLPELLLGTISLAFLFSIGLTLLEIFVIGAFCKYCLVSFGIITAVFILILSYQRQLNKEAEL